MNTTNNTEEIGRLTARVAALEAKLSQLEASQPVRVSLSDKYADFDIKFLPKAWAQNNGEDFRGRRISETSAAFCECLAGFLDWAADKERTEGKTFTTKRGETKESWRSTKERAAYARLWGEKLSRRGSSDIAFVPAHGEDSSDIPF